jgi:hypothetical protein
VSPVDNLQERLKAMQGVFNEAVPDAPGQGPMPPDGKYQALVHAFDTFESNAGQAFLKTQLQLALDGGEWDSHVVETVHNLEDPERIKYVKAHLKVLGLDVDSVDLATLLAPDTLATLLDVPVAITIKRSSKTDGEGNHYVNVYVDRRLGNPMPKSDVDTPPPPPPAPAKTDDDVPF